MLHSNRKNKRVSLSNLDYAFHVNKHGRTRSFRKTFTVWPKTLERNKFWLTGEIVGYYSIVPVETRQEAITQNTYCGKHPDNLRAVYCSDCSKARCLLSSLKHRTHDCLEITEIAEQL